VPKEEQYNEQINNQNINKKKHEPHLTSGISHAEGRRRPPDITIKRKTWLIRLQPPQKMKLNTIKKLIKSPPFVLLKTIKYIFFSQFS
jgi:hypothetical protein